MFNWIWQHVIGVVQNWFLTSDLGLVIAICLGGALLGLAFKFFGWRGVLGAAIALFTFGVYRKGWKDRDSLAAPSQRVKPPGPDRIIPPIDARPLQPRPKPAPGTPKGKPRWNNDNQRWETFNPLTGKWEP